MQFTGHSLPVHQSMSVPWDFLPCPISSAKPTDAISSHNCHWNVSLPSGASPWNGKFGRVEGQNTTSVIVILTLPKQLLKKYDENIVSKDTFNNLLSHLVIPSSTKHESIRHESIYNINQSRGILIKEVTFIVYLIDLLFMDDLACFSLYSLQSVLKLSSYLTLFVSLGQWYLSFLHNTLFYPSISFTLLKKFSFVIVTSCHVTFSLILSMTFQRRF